MMLKEQVEQFLQEYGRAHPEVTATISKTSTGVYKNGIYQMRIYYRSDAIRIEVKGGTTQHGEYGLLLKDKLVFQKSGASPYSTAGCIQFFVEEQNIATVLTRLLESTEEPTEEQKAEFAANDQQYKALKKLNKSADPHPAESAIQSNDPPPAAREVIVVKASDDNKRVEAKLDSLMGAIAKIYSQKNETPTVEISPKDNERSYRVEATNGSSPFLMLKGKAIINNLVFTVKLTAVGLGTTEENYRLFFTNRDGDIISNAEELMVAANREYSCKFTLKSSASKEEKCYLVIQGINAKPNEARQSIEFAIQIAFEADFGF